MPYPIKPVTGGFKVTSANHPKGFSKKPQTKAKARAQQKALYANASPKSEQSRKIRSLMNNHDGDE